jgi:hypothetical protein
MHELYYTRFATTTRSFSTFAKDAQYEYQSLVFYSPVDKLLKIEEQEE